MTIILFTSKHKTFSHEQNLFSRRKKNIFRATMILSLTKIFVYGNFDFVLYKTYFVWAEGWEMSLFVFTRFSFEEMHNLRKILQKMERSVMIFDCIPPSKSNILKVFVSQGHLSCRSVTIIPLELWCRKTDMMVEIVIL